MWVLALGAGCFNGGEITHVVESTSALGSFGRNPGQLSSPRAVACGPKGHVAAIDKTGRVQVFDRQGALVSRWRMPKIEKGTPTGLCFGPQGDLFVADTHYHRVIRYSLRGERVAQFGSYGEGDGQFIYPTDVAVSDDGTVYVAEYGKNDRIVVFDREYAFVSQWGSHGSGQGQFRRPMGLAIDREGCVFVADSVNHRIQRLSPDGEFMLAWGRPGQQLGEFMYPYDVHVSPDDRVLVCEYGNCRVQQFTREGQPCGAFGQPGRDLRSLSSPWSLDVARDGRVYVADTLNHRLLILGSTCRFDSPIQ